MANCPNKSHPDWIKLVAKVGEVNAYRAFIAYGDTIPPLRDLKDIADTFKDIESIKEGVSSIFTEHPELDNIGSQQQYSQYLDGIFPDSKVKDIVYKGVIKNYIFKKQPTFFSSSKDTANGYSTTGLSKDDFFEIELLEEDISKSIDSDGVPFTKEYLIEIKNRLEKLKEKEENEGQVYSIILDIKNPSVFEDASSFKEDLNKQFEKLKKLKKEGFDSAIVTETFDTVFGGYTGLAGINVNNIDEFEKYIGSTYIVFEPKQSHILGNKEDIEGFKRFISDRQLNAKIADRKGEDIKPPFRSADEVWEFIQNNPSMTYMNQKQKHKGRMYVKGGPNDLFNKNKAIEWVRKRNMEQPGVFDTVREEIPVKDRKGTRTTSMYITVDKEVLRNPRLNFATTTPTITELSNSEKQTINKIVTKIEEKTSLVDVLKTIKVLRREGELKHDNLSNSLFDAFIIKLKKADVNIKMKVLEGAQKGEVNLMAQEGTTISVNPNEIYNYSSPEEFVYTLLHELVHLSNTLIFNLDGSELTYEERVYRDNISDSYKEFKDIAEKYKEVSGNNLTTAYGFRDIQEFISEVLSNRGFMSELIELSEFQYEQDQKQLKPWQKIVNAIYRFFMGKDRFFLREKTNNKELYRNAFNIIMDHVGRYEYNRQFSQTANKLAKLKNLTNAKSRVVITDHSTVKDAMVRIQKEYKKQKDDGVKFIGVTRLIKEAGYGTIIDEKKSKGFDTLGNAIHDTIEGIVKDVFKDVEAETGYKVSPKTKESLKSLIKGLQRPGMLMLSELTIPDVITKVVGKADLVTISEKGNIEIYDFKTKLKGFRGYETKFKQDGRISYSDRQKAHLQMSIYRLMLARILGVLPTSMNTVMLKPKVEGNVIVDVELDTTISPTGIDTFNTYNKDMYHVMPAKKAKKVGIENKHVLDSASGVTDNNDSLAEFDFLESLSDNEDNDLQDILDDLIDRLKTKQKILESSVNSDDLANINANKFIQKLEEKMSTNAALILIVKQSHKNTTEITKEIKKIKKDPKLKFTPKILEKWKDYVSSYDALDDLQELLALDLEVVSAKDQKKFDNMLAETIKDKNAIKKAYVTIGIPLMANHLAKFYDRLYVEEKLKMQRKYKELSDDEKAKISEFDYVDNDLDLKKDRLHKATVKLLRDELKKANGDLSIIQRWLDNTMDSRDPVVAAMIQSFAITDGTARKETLIKRLEIHEALANLEKIEKPGIGTDLAEYYNWMVEKNSDGKRTGHYITEFYSTLGDDYLEIIKIASHYNDEQGRIIKDAWREGLGNDRMNEESYNWITGELKKQKKLLNSGEEGIFTIAAINQIQGTIKEKQIAGNAPLNRKEFTKALNEHIDVLVGEGKITKKEKGEININNQKSRDWFNTFQMVEKGILSESAGQEIGSWIYRNSWSFRTPVAKYKNPQWEEFKYELQNPENDPENYKNQFYNLIVSTGQEGDLNIPGKNRLGTRLPSVIKQLSERIQEGQSISTMFHGTVDQSLTLRTEDTYREGITDRILGDDGKIKYFLPIHFTARIEPVDQSFDLPSIYLKYWDMANDHKAKLEILPEMELAKYIVDNRKTVIGEGFGYKIIRKVSKKIGVADIEEPQDQVDKNRNLSGQLNDWFIQVVYGQRSVEGKSINVFGKKISISKSLDMINRYTALNLLGFNFIQGTANTILGESLQIAELVASEYIDVKAYKKGSDFYTKNLGGILNDVGRRVPQNVVSLLLEEGNVLNEYNTVSYRKNSKFRMLMTSNTAYFTSHAGEHLMQGRMYLGFLANKKAYNNKGEHIGQLLDFFSAEDGKLILHKDVDIEKSGWTTEERERFDYKVKGLLSRLHGEYSDMGRVAIQRYALGRMAYTFRKFVVPGFKRRWEKYGYNQRIGGFTEGNYITTSRFLKQLYKDGHMLKFALLTEDFNKLSDTERGNILRTISEITFLMAAIILGNLLIWGLDDDDKENEQLWAFMAYQMFRYKAELLFFISPMQALAILRSPMASISAIENTIDLLGQITHPFERYENGPNKDMLKIWKETRDMIPVYRQLYRLPGLESTINFFR